MWNYFQLTWRTYKMQTNLRITSKQHPETCLGDSTVEQTRSAQDMPLQTVREMFIKKHNRGWWINWNCMQHQSNEYNWQQFVASSTSHAKGRDVRQKLTTSMRSSWTSCSIDRTLPKYRRCSPAKHNSLNWMQWKTWSRQNNPHKKRAT